MGCITIDLQVFASFHGVGQNLSFYCLAILNAASMFGRVLPNFVADYLGPMNMLVRLASLLSHELASIADLTPT